MRLRLAIRTFWRVLRNRAFGQQVDQLIAGRVPTSTSEKPFAPVAQPAGVALPRPPARSEALTLLAALQREARLIDFLKEDLTGYDDAQIGAAVRDVHRDAAAVLERMFALRPLRDQDEGAAVDITSGFDAARIKLVGQVTGTPPYRGTLAHQGWQATRCELPAWTGQDSDALVIAPAEVDVHE